MSATVAKTVALLLASNIFMTFGWYGHLKYRAKPLFLVILVSWAIAFFEYCLQVPANRLGSTVMQASQLKVLQEAMTFIIFAVFSILYLQQRPTLYDAGAFCLMILAVAVSLFQPR